MSQSAEITSALQRAQLAYRDGRMQVVESECRAVIEQQPDNAEAWVLMGAVARHNGYLTDAAEMMRRAAQLKPQNPHIRSVLGGIYLQLRDWRNAQPIFQRLQENSPDPAHENALAKCAWGMGRYESALKRFRRAAEDAPGDGALQVGLAQALISLWRLEEAEGVLDRLQGTAAADAIALLLLARLRFRDGDFSDALRVLDRAAECDAVPAEVHLNRAAVLKLAGRSAAAADAKRRVPPGPRYDARWESFEFALSHRPPARMFGFGELVLQHALDAATVDGMTLEFGVFHGRSLNLIAQRVRSDVHGFDSFRGLPEDWSGVEPAGSYSTGGMKPEVPRHVRLHEGWFDETLPAFLESTRAPVRLAHIDCDLYSSTRTVLENLRPRLREGTILVFDDYLAYPGWREHEFRAFEEFTREADLEFRYIGFDLLDRAASVELTRVGP